MLMQRCRARLNVDQAGNTVRSTGPTAVLGSTRTPRGDLGTGVDLPRWVWVCVGPHTARQPTRYTAIRDLDALMNAIARLRQIRLATLSVTAMIDAMNMPSEAVRWIITLICGASGVGKACVVL
jgi:hypothetical protein